MSTKELLLENIAQAPEPIVTEVWHYLQFLKSQSEATMHQKGAPHSGKDLATHPAVGTWPRDRDALEHQSRLRSEWPE